VSDKVVIVESPAKAKTLNKYLGKDYAVLSSYGHVRDLLPKDGSVRPEEDFAMDWEFNEKAKKAVSEITKAVKAASSVFLASDPDREGEAIAWHIKEILHEKGLDKNKSIKRVSFNEITKKAVTEAISHPREIDSDLVDAYMARRALDYLVGFSLSPVLWRKLPGSRSAGRVQSVALRLICDREVEIEKFQIQEFWSIEGEFLTKEKGTVPSYLMILDGKKLEKFTLSTKEEAQAALDSVSKLSYKVFHIERKQTKRNPSPPFTTSTLQQEASRKLGLGATRTMRIAQGLYEGVDIGGDTVGLITYMRTDGVYLSSEAIAGARAVIEKDYGQQYLPSSPRIYKNKAKNAQEAHEAIRPTDISRRPEYVAKYLNKEQLELYTLIWQKAVASQMTSVVLDQVSVDIIDSNSANRENCKAMFRAAGSVVVFDGWLKVYREGSDDADIGGQKGNDGYGDTRLPKMEEGDGLETKQITQEQHFTQPPPRYTEASLVKKLEELGIGRPSTYASIMQVLQDRDYVRLDKKRFVPEDRGRIVTVFLEEFFKEYVQYDFTADLEEKLDDVSGGRLKWKEVLRDFWKAFSKAVDDTKELKISDVIDVLDKVLEQHFFPKEEGEPEKDLRLCPVCKTGRMGLKLGKFGAFLGCSNYPECKNTRPLAVQGGGDSKDEMAPRELGTDPVTGAMVSVRVGPYGAYVQLDAVAAEPKEDKPKKAKKTKKEAAPKPKRTSLPKKLDPTSIDFDTALSLLSLPREVGVHPETNEKITADIGRFGEYVKMGSAYRSLTPEDDVLTVDVNRAVALLSEPSKGRRASSSAKELGAHPKDSKPITLNKGRFGPYVKWGKVMATVTKDYDPEDLSLENAIEFLDAKAAKMNASGKKPAAKTSKKKK